MDQETKKSIKLFWIGVLTLTTHFIFLWSKVFTK